MSYLWTYNVKDFFKYVLIILLKDLKDTIPDCMLYEDI